MDIISQMQTRVDSEDCEPLSVILYHIDTQTCFFYFLYNICSSYAYISVKIVERKPIVSIDSIELIIADVE